MKKFFGLCILVILLVAISGCTQQTQTTPATTSPTTIATTIATMEPTAVPTTEITTLPVATIATVETTLVATNVTTNVTAEVPTTLSTPRAALTPQTKITTVSMTNNTFTPKVLTVLPGTGITWRNDDTVIHAVKVAGKHAGMFNSGDIIPGSTWSYTFNQDVDTYDIVDPNFPQMNSTIVVKEGQSFSGVI